MAQQLAPAEKIAQIYLQHLQLFASLEILNYGNTWSLSMLFGTHGSWEERVNVRMNISEEHLCQYDGGVVKIHIFIFTSSNFLLYIYRVFQNKNQKENGVHKGVPEKDFFKKIG